jgi:hypothetical protein
MMKRIHFLLAGLVVIFSGCSTYRQTQTPDDVYYSPGADRQEAAATPSNNNQGDYYSVPNDQYVRMRVQDPQKWSYFDDYNTDYYGGYSPVGYNASMGYGYGGMGYGGMGYGGFGISPWIGFGYWSPISYWNSYYSWNGFYNPYYGGVIVSNPKIQNDSYSRVSTFNPASYTNNTYNRGNTRPSSASYTPYSYSQTIRSNYANPNNYNYRNNAGRPSYNQNSGSNYSNQPTRTYSAPTRSSSSFGGGSSGGGGGSRGGGGGGGGVSRPGR